MRRWWTSPDAIHGTSPPQKDETAVLGVPPTVIDATSPSAKSLHGSGSCIAKFFQENGEHLGRLVARGFNLTKSHGVLLPPILQCRCHQLPVPVDIRVEMVRQIRPCDTEDKGVLALGGELTARRRELDHELLLQCLHLLLRST